jgi:hypothetical protein
MAKDKNIAETAHDAFLSDEEKAKIKIQVEEELDAENKKKVAADYKAQLKAEAKKAAAIKNAKPGESAEGLVPLFIDLAPGAQALRIEGVCYHPGITYHVTPAQRDSMLDMMHKGHNHESEVRGTKNSNQYRPKSSYNI